MKIQGFAAGAAKGRLEPFEYDAEPRWDEVLVRITHCGICHSDVHLADGDWGDFFPLVPGHEVVGEVERGRDLEPGTRVGVGWQCGSCGTCEWCQAGKEVVCPDNLATCMGHYGGFASHVIAQSRFVFPLPAGLDSAATAPLFCGGATVYTPLRQFGDPGARVAVIGIGGLGHLAVQFAGRMGYEVTAVSTREDKEAEARSYGASHFLVGDPGPRSFDLILNTTTVNLDMTLWTEALRPEGTFVQLGAAPEPLEVGAFPLIMGYRSVAGTGIAHPNVLQEMLEFSAKHGVEAKVQVLPMSDCNEAMAITRSGSARYRIVLER
jgi:uncharacterized zinc-type alcohol dehydrogenase-like protein